MKVQVVYLEQECERTPDGGSYQPQQHLRSLSSSSQPASAPHEAPTWHAGAESVWGRCVTNTCHQLAGGAQNETASLESHSNRKGRMVV